MNSFYFEDHDDTFAFEQNIYLEKKYVVNGDHRSMTIVQTVEGLFTPRYETYDLKIRHHIQCSDEQPETYGQREVYDEEAYTE